MPVDLAVYLVTDSTKAILGDRDLLTQVDEAIQGGVTIVQYRDKHADTGELIQTATKIHEITKRHGVPLLINDRVDVAQAIGAEGVHLGQDDMHITAARKILGRKAIIGISTSTIDEAKRAINQGADYLGVGAMFGTPTKDDTKHILGPLGTRSLLSAISSSPIPTVAIGGIKPTNASRILYQSSTPEKPLSGIAVVSAIITSADPKSTASQLRSIVTSPPTYRLLPSLSLSLSSQPPKSPSDLLTAIPSLLSHHRTLNPLSHNMTNTVVQNFAANVCLSTSSSPIMSLSGSEASDLALLRGGLVINMGTLTPELMTSYLSATLAYNSAGNPIVFDPVGAGATALRRAAVSTLTNGSYFSVIKGNEAEISTVYAVTTNSSSQSSSSAQAKGVDSGPSTSSPTEKATLVKSLAIHHRNVVLMTGPTDYLSDGTTVLAIRNGHAHLGRITGSGCALGAVIAGFLASARDLAEKNDDDKATPGGADEEGVSSSYLTATLAALLLYSIAAETAVESGRVFGPGSFIPAFVDALYQLTNEDVAAEWLGRARVEVLHV